MLACVVQPDCLGVIFHGGTGGQDNSCRPQQLCTLSCSHVTISESTVHFEFDFGRILMGFGILNFEF